MYDVRVDNARIFDPEDGSFREGAVLIDRGLVAGVGPEVQNPARQIIDARGQTVVPGLIDEHVHIDYEGSLIGANADTLCVPCGITSVCDGGTCGVSSFGQFLRSNLMRYEAHGYAYLNVQTYGNKSVCLHEEDHDPADFRADLITACFQRHKEVLRGLKIRLCRGTLGNSGLGLAALEAAQAIATALKAQGFHCPLVVHYGDLPEDLRLEDILRRLKAGDIVAHILQTHGETIFEDAGGMAGIGGIKECVLEARARGVIFDDCHGRVHWSFASLEKAGRAGFKPDIISSDNIRLSEYQIPGFSLLYAMAAQSAAGMATNDILHSVTAAPARALGISERAGCIHEGMPADLTILEIRHPENLILHDNEGQSRPARELFVPLLTMISGRVAFRQIFFI